MRTWTWIGGLLAAVMALGPGLWAPAASPAPNEAPSSGPPKVPGMSDREAQEFALFMLEAIHKVRDEYIRPVNDEKLAGVAIQSLFEASGAPIPEAWRGDPAAVMAGRDILSELTRGRKAAGKPAALQGANAVRISLQAIVQQLDPYCAYITADELSRNQFDGAQVGVGIQVEERTGPGPLYVRSVLIGSSAQTHGVLPGDQIWQINGEPTEQLSARQGLHRLDGPPRTAVKLVVQSLGSRESRNVDLERTLVHEDSVLGVRRNPGEGWDYLVDSDQRIAYIRLGSLKQSNAIDGDGPVGTSTELDEALTLLRRSGLAGLILDLRDCPIGIITQAANIAGLFLPADTAIAVARYRPPRNPMEYTSHSGKHGRLPLVVIVGPDTSGAGEMIAAALQDNHRAAIVGQRTRGKDTMQPADNSAGEILIRDSIHGLRLSTGRFFRPSGKNLGRLLDSKPWDDWGVRPDDGLEVPLTADLRRQIRRWRLAQDLRPAQAREILPLDDPANDPSLFAGLREVRRLIQEQGKDEGKPAAKARIPLLDPRAAAR